MHEECFPGQNTQHLHKYSLYYGKWKKIIYFINCYWSLYVISIKEEHFVIIQKEIQIDHVNMTVSIWKCEQNHNWPTKYCLLDIYKDQIQLTFLNN